MLGYSCCGYSLLVLLAAFESLFIFILGCEVERELLTSKLALLETNLSL